MACRLAWGCPHMEGESESRDCVFRRFRDREVLNPQLMAPQKVLVPNSDSVVIPEDQRQTGGPCGESQRYGVEV